MPQNRAKAAALMQKAADAGLPSAQYNLALLYVEGAYVEPNQIKAAGLMEEAAEAGLADAEFDFGVMLTTGAGIAPDPARGAVYIRRGGRSRPVRRHGRICDAQVSRQGRRPGHRERRASGTGVAANLGNPVAQNRLAILLAAGDGVRKDLQTAAMWRALARRAGLIDPRTDQLLADISPADLTTGRGTGAGSGRAWRPTRAPDRRRPRAGGRSGAGGKRPRRTDAPS